MAANDEFPRGWQVGSLGPPDNAHTITIPAVPGVAHVLTNVISKLLNTSAAASNQVAVTCGANNLFELFTPTGPAIDSGEWTGKITGRVGAALSVNVGGGGGSTMYLSIQGYDI